MMLDLDNTLIDRDQAFRRWAEDFVAMHGGETAKVDWVVEADRDGYEVRERLAALLGERFGVADTAALTDDLRRGMVDRIELDPAVPDALHRARGAGWTLIVVTNGAVGQQERKLRHTGLDLVVDGWVISEGLGIRKPAPGIFAAAADLASVSLAGSWMVGDSADHDIVGAHAVGARSVWLQRGRPWPDHVRAPNLMASSFAEAVDLILDQAPSLG